MRKPSFLNWAGQRVLAIYDGMNDVNKSAIANETYDELCLFAGDWEDLSHFSTVADKVRRLTVTARGRVDIGAIVHLTGLRYLRLNEGYEAVAPKLVFDFSSLIHLEECYIGWQKNYSTNLFDCPKLASLTIWQYHSQGLGDIARAAGLRSLDISDSPLVNLAGIEQLSHLEALRLGPLRKFEDLSGVENVASLTSIAIQKCPKLSDLSSIYRAKGLQRFTLNSKFPVADLEFFSCLPNLREFIFDCQVVKQDFTPLFKLRKLRLGRFLSLRDFTATDDELGDLARQAGRTMTLEVLGRGRKEQTVTFSFED